MKRAKQTRFEGKDAAQPVSEKRLFLFNAQTEVNRAVSLYNTAAFGEARTLLAPDEYSDDAIDIKINLAIDALEKALVTPRRRPHP